MKDFYDCRSCRGTGFDAMGHRCDRDAAVVAARAVSTPCPPLATDRQMSYYNALVQQRDTSWVTMVSHDRLTKAETSKRIDAMLKMPMTPISVHRSAESSVEPVTDGFYISTETNAVYKVQRTRDGCNLYAKTLSTVPGGGFVYSAGLFARVVNSINKGTIVRLSLERAKQYGTLYGICCCCGAVLTDEKSIKAGIGPICASKF